jgi:uncharacterized membrane protein
MPKQENYVWPMVAIAVVIAPQVVVPTSYRLGPPTLVPIVEAGAFLAMLVITAKPGPVPRVARPTLLVLIGALIVANAAAAVRLVVLVLGNEKVDGASVTADRLLVAGGMVLASNIVMFAVFYWQLDGGGPAGRVASTRSYPDFMFPQTVSPEVAPDDWRPRFGDHLYLSYTNIVAFSPTDTLPLTIRAKALMAVQSAISVAVLVVVLARVINILPG